MSVQLKIDNYTSINLKEQTTLNADTTIGSGSLTLTNNQNIAANDYLLIGNPGSETGEILSVQSVSGATIATTGSTTLQHNRFDPVRALIGNQIKIYRALNTNGLQPDDSNFSSIATIAIDPDQISTLYTDGSGSAAYWYKFTYFNQTTSAETNIADSGSARGGGTNDYVSLDSVRNEAGFKNNRNISDSLISQFRRQAQDTVNGALSGKFSVPFVAPINATIERVTLLYAAGYLQIDQFGQTYNLDAQGKQNAKLTEADSIIAKLQSGQLSLIDTGGNDTAISNATEFATWPNDTTNGASYDQGGDAGPMFRVSYVLGRRGRKY